jgi:predicted transposase YbfD/YdcC
MSCQKEAVKKIREKGADYILAVKENQKGLRISGSILRVWRAGR